MQSLSFFVPLKKIPTVTAQQKRVNTKGAKPVYYDDHKLKQARSLLTAHIGQHYPGNTLMGPVRLVVKWLYPMTKKSINGQYKTTKPDLDNANKLLQDCMTDIGFWKDDSQVASLTAEKFFSDVVGIYIEIIDLS